MSFRFWPDKKTSINLGSPFVVLKAFSDMAKVTMGSTQRELNAYPALFGVVHTDDQDLNDDYVADVRTQAGDFLERYGEDLSKDAKEILELLT